LNPGLSSRLWYATISIFLLIKPGLSGIAILLYFVLSTLTPTLIHPIDPPSPHEAVKKLLQVERAGRDIEKVLQRYLFG
jgi:hypothetical protein